MVRSTLVAYSELRLGDVVEVTAEGPFNTCTVTKIGKDEITLHRPYGQVSDFSYGEESQVIHYTGLEVFTIPLKIDRIAKLWHRKEIR